MKAANPTFQFLSLRNPGLVEWMDRPDCDPVTLRNTYRYFPVINRFISRWHTVYRHHIRPLLRHNRRNSLLDVGSGGGDITKCIHKWAAHDGFVLDVSGIDPDPRAHEFVLGRNTGVQRRETDGREGNFVRDSSDRQESGRLHFLQADTGALRHEGRTFDFVICNHVLHHLSDHDLLGFLEDLDALSDRRVVCSDIERSAIGFGLFSLATWPLFPNSFIRADGLISIRKSYRAEELRDAVPHKWQIVRQFPFRLLLILEKSGNGQTDSKHPD